jgi:hypothetical protein
MSALNIKKYCRVSLDLSVRYKCSVVVITLINIGPQQPTAISNWLDKRIVVYTSWAKWYFGSWMNIVVHNTVTSGMHMVGLLGQFTYPASHVVLGSDMQNVMFSSPPCGQSKDLQHRSQILLILCVTLFCVPF